MLPPKANRSHETHCAQTHVVSFPDLYAGKIVAALDRQHPRDLFDIRDLLATEGIDDQLRRAFVVYLISHNRPTHEVIDPRLKDINHEYERGAPELPAVRWKQQNLDKLDHQARSHLVSRLVNALG